MMIRFALSLFSVFATLLVLSPVAAQGVAVEAAPVEGPASDKLPSALLWKIEGAGINPSFLFGTIHMIDADHFFLPDGTEEAIGQVSQVVFEIDMDEMTDIGALMGLLMNAPMPDGLRLSDLLGEEDYTLVEEHFKDMGLPMLFLDRIKPMILSVFASTDMAPGGGSGAMMSYEMEFYSKALDMSLPVGGLESMAYQMSVFDSIPYEEQAEMLVDAIRSQDTGDEEFQKLIDTYIAQDIDLLSELVVSGENGVGDHEQVLLVNRNRNWIPLMVDMMKKEPVFFAVGAGHLGGDNGVIRMLRAEGFRLTPVTSATEVSRGRKF